MQWGSKTGAPKVTPSRGARHGVREHAARCQYSRAFALGTAYAHVRGAGSAPSALDDWPSRTAAPLSSATELHPPRSNRRSRDVPDGAGAVLLDHKRSHDAETTGWELRDEAIATGLQATGDPQCITSTVAARAGREGANAQAAGRRYCLPGQRVRGRDVHAPSCVPAKALQLFARRPKAP